MAARFVIPDSWARQRLRTMTTILGLIALSLTRRGTRTLPVRLAIQPFPIPVVHTVAHRLRTQLTKRSLLQKLKVMAPSDMVLRSPKHPPSLSVRRFTRSTLADSPSTAPEQLLSQVQQETIYR